MTLCDNPLTTGTVLCHTNRVIEKDDMNTQLFWVGQTQPDGTNEVLWECTSLTQAEAEVDRINSSLAAHGIPSYVSCAYVIN